MPKQTARPKRPAAARLKSGFCMSRGTVRHRAQPLRTVHREKALNAENSPQTRHFLRYPHYTKASQRCIAKISKSPPLLYKYTTGTTNCAKPFFLRAFLLPLWQTEDTHRRAAFFRIMSRLTRILLCVVLLVVIAVTAMAAYLYASLSAEAVKERLTAYAADNLASDLHLTGEITVKRFPALEVTLPAARLTSKTDGHETARFDSARFSASLWSLALGAVRVSDAEIAGLKTTVTAREPSLTAFLKPLLKGPSPKTSRSGNFTSQTVRSALPPQITKRCATGIPPILISRLRRFLRNSPPFPLP